MRVIFIVTLFNLINVILAQFDIINEDIGDLQIHAKVGNLPLKYSPLSENDQKASNKAADVIDFIPLVPYIDPLAIPVVHAFGVDIPFLFLRGKVYLENFVLSGVKQLQLNNVELRLINLRGDINITIPQLHVEADLNVRASLSFLPLMLSCHISTFLYDVGVVATGGGYRAKSPAVGEVLQIQSAAVNVNIRDIVFNLTHLVLGEELKEDDGPSLVTQLFGTKRRAGSQSDDGNIFNGLLKNVLGMVNKELFKFNLTHLVLGEELKEDDGPSLVTQLFGTKRRAGSQSDDGNIFNGLLKNVLGMVNKELFKVPMEGFMEYLLSDTY